MRTYQTTLNYLEQPDPFGLIIYSPNLKIVQGEQVPIHELDVTFYFYELVSNHNESKVSAHVIELLELGALELYTESVPYLNKDNKKKGYYFIQVQVTEYGRHLLNKINSVKNKVYYG